MKPKPNGPRIVVGPWGEYMGGDDGFRETADAPRSPRTGQDSPKVSDASEATNGASGARRIDVGGIRESAFRDTVVQYARYRGWRVMWTWNSRHSPKGWPDLFMVRGDRLIAAELKVGRNKPTQDQWDWLKALFIAGVETYVWYPDMWNDIEEVLR